MIIIDGKLATPSDPWVRHCGFCGRPETVCDADDHGCGTTPAEDAFGMTAAVESTQQAMAAMVPMIRKAVADMLPPSGWRDRDKLL